MAFLMPGLRQDGHWLLRMHPVYLAPALLVFLAILGLPEDMAVRSPLLGRLVRWLVEMFPFLGGHALVSTLPQLITVVKASTFALIPVVVVLPFLFLWKDRHHCLQLNLEAGLPVPWWLELSLALFLLLAFVGNWVAAPDPSTCAGCTTGSRLGLAAIDAASLLSFTVFPIGLATTLYVRLGMTFGVREG